MIYEVLVAARKSLQDRGWTKHRATDWETGAGCAIQHLIWATREVGVPDDARKSTVYEVEQFILGVNDLRGSHLPDHNDHILTEREDVERWFDRAIAAARPPLPPEPVSRRRWWQRRREDAHLYHLPS